MRFWYFTLAIAALTNALPHGPDDDDAVTTSSSTTTIKALTTDALPSTVTYGYHPTKAQEAVITPMAKADSAGSSGASCTRTVMHVVQFHNLRTCTDYAATTTVTKLVECGGCALKVREFGGPGPVVRCMTRTQVPMSTVTVMGCGGHTADVLMSEPTFPARM